MRNLLLVLCLAFSFSAVAADWKDYYSVETIPLPEGVDPQIGGVTVLKDGCVACCFFGGEVKIYSPHTKTWSNFASGLQTPLGIVENEDGSLTVMQWAELTKLTDTNHDGTADHYETLFDGFGVSGNYHEFAFGPARDSKGNMYIALNVGSNFAGVNKYFRGPFSEIGFLNEEEMLGWANNLEWPQTKHKAGRMFSRVPYRGWVMKIAPDGTVTPFASGFRSPDGIGVDDQDRVWVTDNQGDWRGTSPLYLVEEGNFYGHPASLVWKKGWTRNPLEVPVEELEALRTPAAALFTHGELANSPTEPIVVPEGNTFGLPAGELLIGEMNQPTLIRYLADEVDGVVQGTLIPFLNKSKLGMGNHRFSFGPDRSLWVGKIHLGWAGDEGFRRVRWNGKTPFLVDQVKLLADGFDIHFNEALSDKALKIEVFSHTYHYHAQYGSPKVDEKFIASESVTVAGDKRSVRLKLLKLEARRLYTIKVMGAESAAGQRLMGDILRYNAVAISP